MASGPSLLAPIPSDTSLDRDFEEEDALLTGRGRRSNRIRSLYQKWRETGLLVWALCATIVVIVLAVVVQHNQARLGAGHDRSGGWGADGKPSGKRNLIFMVSDGMGPTSLSLTRSFRQFESELAIDDVLVLDRHLIGSSRTRSNSSLVTDSAAGATAFSCGEKSYNGAISVLPDHSPCGSVLEAAKAAGYLTGLVVTTRITDATPACFASHADLREYEDLIAEQIIGNYPLGRTVDLILGGGRCHFLPNTAEGSCRVDATDVIAMASHNNYSYISSRSEFDSLQSSSSISLPLLGLFADYDIPYEIDRRHNPSSYPSQIDMTHFALQALSAATRDSDKGFFLMIEGSRIDHTGHANDPAAQVHEVLLHDASFAAVVDFLATDSVEGVLVSTSDHETGGLATAVQLTDAYPQYEWNPKALANAKHSVQYLDAQWQKWVAGDGAKANQLVKRKWIHENLFEAGLGLDDATDADADLIIGTHKPVRPTAYILAEMISAKAEIGWTTHGHTAVDVNIYASSPKHAPQLVGNHENTEVGRFMTNYLDLDLSSVTKALKKGKVNTGIGAARANHRH